MQGDPTLNRFVRAWFQSVKLKYDNSNFAFNFNLRRYLKYFTGSSGAMGDDYKGGRDFDALSAWAKENLGPSCGAENIDLCDDEQKAGWVLRTSSRLMS